jgi:hypothetical protein
LDSHFQEDLFEAGEGRLRYLMEEASEQKHSFEAVHVDEAEADFPGGQD